MDLHPQVATLRFAGFHQGARSEAYQVPEPAARVDQLLAEWADYIEDRSQPVDEVTLHRLVKRCATEIQRCPPEQRPRLFNFRGTVYLRMKKLPEAVADFVNAANLDLSSASYAVNAAAASIESSRLDDGLEWLREARRRPQTSAEIAFAIARNWAALEVIRGDATRASRAFEEARSLANRANPVHWFSMAESASDLGREDDAVELYAQHLATASGETLGETPAVEFIRRVKPNYRVEVPSQRLRSAIDAVCARWDSPEPDDSTASSIVLSGPAWARLREEIEANPQPTPELRSLVHGRGN